MSSDLEETLDAADIQGIEFRDRLAAQQAADRRRPVDIVDASVGESKEALSLLRKRLAAVTLALSIGFSIFAVWLTISKLLGFISDTWPWMIAEYTVTVVLIGTTIWLRGKGPMTSGCARAIELMVFGLPSIIFAAHTMRTLITSVEQYGK